MVQSSLHDCNIKCMVLFFLVNFSSVDSVFAGREHMDRKTLLKKVLMDLESSGGSNTDHKTVTTGIHKGHTAQGAYGLMLNTAKEIVKRKKEQDELDKQLLTINDDAGYSKFLSDNPHKYDEYVNTLIDRVYHRSEKDIPTAATMWHWGHNLSKERALDILERNPQYFDRVIQAIRRHSKKK